MNSVLVYASPALPQATTAEEQPKPGTIIIVTFENGTTKAIRSDSTNLQAVTGGYFIADSSVKASQPLQSKTISNTVVQQLVSVFIDVSIVDDDAPPTSSKGCGEGYGYYVDDPKPTCEPLDKIGQGPPPDQAFCAALGCPYNPPAESELPKDNNNLATTPVTPTEPTAAEQAQEAPITEPDTATEEQNGEESDENQNEEGDSSNGDGGDGDDGGDGSSTEGEGDSPGGGDESEE